MKRPVVLLAALVVLLGIYWLVQKSSKPVVEADRPFVQVDSAKVNKLNVVASGESVEMVKEGDNWNMIRPVTYPAASKTVQSAIGKFKDMKRLTLITSKRDRFREFQVDDSAGAKVTVGDGKNSYTVWLGKMSPSGNSYARMDGSDDIWEVGGNNAGTFKRKAKDWRDKTITELNAADIRKITIRYPSETMMMERQDTMWTVSNGKTSFIGTKGPADRITNLLARMQTVDFVDSLAPTAFDASAATITVELTSGSPIELKLIPKDAEATQYFLRKTGASADFVIYKATAEVLMKKTNDFKDQPAKATAEPAKGKNKAKSKA
ncbi:MAG TPA: DUF4340 domain-containing protein [bacterium]|jgi:hypothetical protein